MKKRDTSRDGLRNQIRYFSLTHFPSFWNFINHNKTLQPIFNRMIINGAVNLTKHRPHQFSAYSKYTSWQSLTDQYWYGRHLPPVQNSNKLPEEKSLSVLFESKERRYSQKSTLLFASFAQWFTDGILLTKKGQSKQTTTSHQIDLSQLYGSNQNTTLLLREKSNTTGCKGRLLSQIINGEEFSPYLYNEDGSKKSIFIENTSNNRIEVPNPIDLDTIKDFCLTKKRTLFAFGGDRANVTPQTAMINTLFLREHNRIANIIEKSNITWDDERIFETTRNILIVILIKIVIEEYINHISPYLFQFKADPSVSWNAQWNRPNWFAIEFNLLYRWHSLIPDTINWGSNCIQINDWIYNNAPLTDVGLGAAFDYTSKQKSCEIGLFNTSSSLSATEIASIRQGRVNELDSYNAYRKAMRFPELTKFEQLSSDQKIIDNLKRLYNNNINDIDFYVGLFAEDPRQNSAVPSLIGRMVAIDAFSQALTNPLLSKNVFNDATFTRQGMSIINETSCLNDLVKRNTNNGSFFVSMTQRSKDSQ